jgi:hypothetical protein
LASQVNGPVEVFLQEYQFSTAADASGLLQDPNFTGVGGQGYATLPSSDAIDGGIAGTINSAANGGLQEYRLQWASGTTFVTVNVLGENLSIQQVQSVASQVQT